MLNSVSYSIMLNKLWSIETTTVVWKYSLLKIFMGNETHENIAAKRLLEEMKAIYIWIFMIRSISKRIPSSDEISY